MKTATKPKADELELVALEAEKFRLDKLLRQWQRVRLHTQTLEAARDEKLRPLRERFDKDAAPIVAAADQELAPLASRLQELENELTVALLGSIKADGTIPIPQLEYTQAIAQVTIDEKREISPAELFAHVPAADRHSKFWDCFRVLIGETTQFLGKPVVSRLAKFNRTHGVTIRLKD